MAGSDLQGTGKSTGAERRKQRRTDRRINVDIKDGGRGFEIHGKTWNLSSAGAYCRVNRPIPEMTQLMMVLALPEKELMCRGTVVRQVSDPDNPDYCQLAIFFHDMSEKDRARLSAFVEH